MKLEDDFDVRVFILYILNHITEPLEFTTINDMIMQDGFVNYFDFALSFSELLEKGQIIEIEQDGKKLYEISKTGKLVLESYEGNLIGVIKDRALRSALRMLSFYKDGNKIKTEIKEVDGGFSLICSIRDNKKTLFSVETFLTERDYAEMLRDNFEDRAEIIFKGALSLLSGDVNYIFD